jgi:predicted nucleotidyltransferase
LTCIAGLQFNFTSTLSCRIKPHAILTPGGEQTIKDGYYCLFYNRKWEPVGNDSIEAQRLLMKKRGELLTVANGGTVVQTQEEVAWPKITVFVQKFTLDRYSKNQESTLMTEEKFQRFSGASRYVLSDELAKIVNVSMALESREPERPCSPTP